MYNMLYNDTMEAEKYTFLRVRTETRRRLKVVAALRDESMLATLDYLVAQELTRLQSQQRGNTDVSDTTGSHQQD